MYLEKSTIRNGD